MDTDHSALFQILSAALLLPIGWLWTRINSLFGLHNEVTQMLADHKELVAKEYVPRTEINKALDKVTVEIRAGFKEQKDDFKEDITDLKRRMDMYHE